MNVYETYIRRAAAARGIDPDIAVRVAKSEGGLTDPFRQGDSILSYGREESYGPFQLHMRGGGVGERALKAGIDPRKNWQGGIDYALNEAAQRGWGQWFGAGKAGIGDWEGVKGARPVGLTINSVPDVEPGSRLHPEISPAGSMVRNPLSILHEEISPVPAGGPVEGITPSGATGDVPNVTGLIPGIGDATSVMPSADPMMGFLNAFSGAAKAFGKSRTGKNASGISPSSIGQEDPGRYAAAAQLMATLLANRKSQMPGLTIG